MSDPKDIRGSVTESNSSEVTADVQSAADAGARHRAGDAEPKQRKTSERKVVANRENAKKSTGPKTDRGKANSSRNSIRHGLLSKATLIKDGPGRESRRRFRELYERYIQEWNPVGPTEEQLIDEMVTCEIRMERGARFENGVIRQEYDNHLSRFGNPYEQIHKTWWRIHYQLRKLREEVEETGSASAETIDGLIALLNAPPQIPMHINQLRETMEEQRIAKLLWQGTCEQLIGGGNLLSGPLKRRVLAELDGQADSCARLMHKAEHDLERYRDSLLGKGSLPPDAALDKFLKYNTAAQRRLDKVRRIFIDLQDRRLGRGVYAQKNH